MSQINWTIDARADLRRIDEWLRLNASGEIATRTLEAIGVRSTQLLDFPLSGPLGQRDERSLRVTGTPYILVYRARASEIEILRIRHNREDWREGE